MTPDPLPEPVGLAAHAEALLAAFLARSDSQNEVDFEAFCREHAVEADTLRRLAIEKRHTQATSPATRDATRAVDALAALPRAPQSAITDCEVAPDSATSASSSGAIDELLKRLAQRAPSGWRYTLQGEVARGGMGAILKVWDEDLRRHSAMKVVLGRGESAPSGETPPVDSKQLARFLEEAQIAGQLDHPGIVPVYELGLDNDGRVYFTMRLVKGVDLRSVFEQVRTGGEGWNQTRALGVLLKVCEALSYAHAKGVIHRDLKPANVMVGKYGEVYVMDWGLARVLGQPDRHDLRLRPAPSTALSAVESERRKEREESPDSPIVTMDGDVVGTPSYMPPEQARGELERLGPHSDVYSLGAMLYDLLSGEMPFVPQGARVSQHTILMRVIEGPPRPLVELAPRTPVELIAICERAMAREPKDRYGDMRELAEDLRAYLERRVVRAYETGAWAETKKWLQRNKTLATSLAAAVALLAVGLVTSLSYKSQSDRNAAIAEERRRDSDANAERARASEAEAKLQTEIAQRNESRAKESESFAKASEAKAKREKERADDQARIATQRASDVLSLSARQELTELVERADGLWPAFPDKLGAYDNWLADARVLVDGRSADPALGIDAHPGLRDHEAKLLEIRLLLAWALARGGRLDEALTEAQCAVDDVELSTSLKASLKQMQEEQTPQKGDESRAKDVEGTIISMLARVAGLDSGLVERGVVEFADARARWWRDQLSQLVADLKAFSEEKSGLFSKGTSERHGWGIVKRREEAAAIEERSVSGTDAKLRWDEATTAIAASARYGGLMLTPELGLLPIGEDPGSHLWEFAHLQTGEPAERGADGRLILKEETGLVFVLIPGGTFWMGAQRKDPNSRNYDPQATSVEAPVHQMTLDPYFLSKYEMTQGQWEHFAGHNPSHLGPRNFKVSWNRNGKPWSRMHPVEHVSWTDCTLLLDRMGLRLPTEAQWEHGCRAGTSSAYASGDAKDSVSGMGNVADAYAKDNGDVSPAGNELWDDGNTFHAEVGSYVANGFGLYDMHGNVWEWCRDAFGNYELPASTGDGERQVAAASLRMYRGGSFDYNASGARSATRGQGPPELHYVPLGLRPARALRLTSSPLHAEGK